MRESPTPRPSLAKLSANLQRRAVDSACYDLAEYFLATVLGHDTEDIWALAQALQAVCEAAIREIEDRPSNPPDAA